VQDECIDRVALSPVRLQRNTPRARVERRREIVRVSEQVQAAELGRSCLDDIAEIDTDAELDSRFPGLAGVLFSH